MSVSTPTAAVHHDAGHHGAGHHDAHHDAGGHWDYSIAPFAVVFGVFFLVPGGFSAFFVYHSILLAVVLAGIGVPLLLFGVSRWIAEGMAGHAIIPGLAPISLGLFIVSEIFIFLSAFAAYWYTRLTTEVWPPAGTPEISVVLPLIMTVILVSSSFVCHNAEEKLEHGDLGGFRRSLLLTLALGLAFLCCTIFEYHHLSEESFVPSTNTFSMIFFAITGFHASHVLVGLCAFLAVLIPALSGRTNKTFLTCVSIYWHFVDIVWFFVVSQIYLW